MRRLELPGGQTGVIRVTGYNPVTRRFLDRCAKLRRGRDIDERGARSRAPRNLNSEGLQNGDDDFRARCRPQEIHGAVAKDCPTPFLRAGDVET